MESWKVPLKMNYILILAFFTLIVVFMAPLGGAEDCKRDYETRYRALLRQQRKLRPGNLDVRLNLRREDEMELLINALNHMVAQD